jgi:hypothetical protein
LCAVGETRATRYRFGAIDNNDLKTSLRKIVRSAHTDNTGAKNDNAHEFPDCSPFVESADRSTSNEMGLFPRTMPCGILGAHIAFADNTKMHA